MSFRITVPRCENYNDFEDAIATARVTPKIDGRTKQGRLQTTLVDQGKNALMELAAGAECPYSGMIKGAVNDDLTGNVTVTMNLLVDKS